MPYSHEMAHFRIITAFFGCLNFSDFYSTCIEKKFRQLEVLVAYCIMQGQITLGVLLVHITTML